MIIGRGVADVHYGHIAADEIHDVSAGVRRIDDDALRVKANRNAHDVASISHAGWRVDGRLAVGIELHAHDLVNPRGHYEAFVVAVLEGDGDGGGDEASGC